MRQEDTALSTKRSLDTPQGVVHATSTLSFITPMSNRRLEVILGKQTDKEIETFSRCAVEWRKDIHYLHRLKTHQNTAEKGL